MQNHANGYKIYLSPFIPLLQALPPFVSLDVMLQQPIRPRKPLSTAPSPSASEYSATGIPLFMVLGLLMPDLLVLLFERLRTSFLRAPERSLIGVSAEVVVSKCAPSECLAAGATGVPSLNCGTRMALFVLLRAGCEWE